jgi:hypothetical protein
MFRVAGAFALGTNGFENKLAIHGELLVCTRISSDSNLYVSSMHSCDDSIKLNNRLGFNGVLELDLSSPQESVGSLKIVTIPSDGLSGKVAICNSITFASTFEVPSEINEGAGGAFYVSNSLNETGLSGFINIGSGVCDGLMDGRFELKTSIDTDSFIVQEELRFSLDGRDFTSSLLSADINFYGKGIYADFNATIAGRFSGAGIAEFEIYGEKYSFIIEENTVSKNTSELWGRAVQSSDINSKEEIFAENVQASSLVDKAIWLADDYTVSLMTGVYSYIELLRLLADETGGELRVCANGNIYVVNPYDRGEVVSPKAIFEITELEETAQNSGIRVVSGLGADPVIETLGRYEKASFGEVYVYTDEKVSVQADSQILKRKDRQLIRNNEQVRFADGTAVTSYPVFRLIDGAKACEGRKLYSLNKASYIGTVVYETIKETYLLYDDNEKEALFSAHAVKTAFTAGTSEAVKELTQKLTADSKIAQSRASNMHKKYGGGRFIELSHLFCAATAKGKAVMIKTPKGIGHAIESSIRVSSAPLKIIQKTKIYCPKEINNG